MKIGLEEIYGDVGIDEARLDTLLNRSLNPRPATMLYDKMGSLGLGSDVGQARTDLLRGQEKLSIHRLAL